MPFCCLPCPLCGASGVPRDPTRSIASQRTFVRPSSACRAWGCKDSAISHPKLCHQSSRILPSVIPNSANSHPELDSGSLYRLHPNTESSCLKLTSRRSLSPVEGPCKKNAPSSRIRFGSVKADGRTYTDAKSSSHDGVVFAKKESSLRQILQKRKHVFRLVCSKLMEEL